MTPARRDLARWALSECRRPRELSARVQDLARAEGVRPPTVWKSMSEVIRADLEARREALRHRGYPPITPGTTVSIILPGPAVGQGRPRIMGGRAAGSGLSSEWGRFRAERAWLTLRALTPAVCVDACRLWITVCRPGARLVKPDLDNVLKLHLDALMGAGCILDDARCQSLTVEVQDGPEQVSVTLTAC